MNDCSTDKTAVDDMSGSRARCTTPLGKLRLGRGVLNILPDASTREEGHILRGAVQQTQYVDEQTLTEVRQCEIVLADADLRGEGFGAETYQ